MRLAAGLNSKTGPTGTDVAASTVLMSRPPRLAGFDYIGRFTYFLTLCVRERATVFRQQAMVDLVLMQIRRTAREHGFSIAAYCFMPDHVHLLVEGSSGTSDLRAFAKLARQRAGGLYARATGSSLWQRGYYDRVLRRSDDISRFTKYIVENPVRAGLVENANDYPYVWSRLGASTQQDAPYTYL